MTRVLPWPHYAGKFPVITDDDAVCYSLEIEHDSVLRIEGGRLTVAEDATVCSHVSLSGNMLTISGHKEGSSEEKGENFYMSERSFGSFRRTITLPEGVDADKVKAEQKDGLLTVRVAKHQGAKARQIPVQAAKD